MLQVFLPLNDYSLLAETTVLCSCAGGKVLMGKRPSWMLNGVTFLSYSVGKSNPEDKWQTNRKKLQLHEYFCALRVIHVFNSWSSNYFQCKLYKVFYKSNFVFLDSCGATDIHFWEKSWNQLIPIGNRLKLFLFVFIKQVCGPFFVIYVIFGARSERQDKKLFGELAQ